MAYYEIVKGRIEREIVEVEQIIEIQDTTFFYNNTKTDFQI